MIHLRLAGFYLFYFAALGALIPYWGLYLKSLGFSAGEIGELIAILMATKIIAPNVWGWIGDHTGRRMAIVRGASLCAALAFAGVFLGRGYAWLALVMAVYGFFWNAALPQFEAVTMNHLADQTARYSRVRMWGSIGFILAVAVLGPLLERQGTAILPALLLVLLSGIWVSSLVVPEAGVPGAAGAPGRLREVVRRPAVAALLAVCFLMQMSHGPYYTFYTIYLEDHGYSRGAIGQLWALGVAAEIGVFLVMHRLLPRFGVRRLLLASLALTTLRWLLLAWFVESIAVMVFAQVLHAASFGVYHAVAITLVHRFFTGRHQGRGQALYSSLGFGAGGAVGSLWSGYVWEGLGPGAAYLLAAGISAAAYAVAARGIETGAERPGRPEALSR